MKPPEYSERLDKRFHPDEQLKEVLTGAGKQWAKFNDERIDPDYFALWARYFDRLFREEPGIDQTRAIFVELQRRGFTNLKLRDACNAIVTRCRKWPFVADFLDMKQPDNDLPYSY